MPQQVPASLRHELALLVLSRYPLVLIESAEETRVERLATTVAGDLGLTLLVWSSAQGLFRRGAGAIEESRDPDHALRKVADLQVDVLALFKDLHPYFDRPEVVRRVRDVATGFARSNNSLLLSGVQMQLPIELQPLAARLELQLPGQPDLERIVRATARELEQQGRARIELSEGDVAAIATALRGLDGDEVARALHQAALRDRRLALDDLHDLMAGKKKRIELAGQLEWVEALAGLAQLGGVPRLKRWVERRRGAFTEEARRFGLPAPKGLLLVGVPGAGKSRACLAIAGELGLPCVRLDAGRLYDKFIGESEANLRRTLATCDAMAPIALWIDEIEKALAAGGGTADDGLSQRLLGTLLTWLQERPQPVFLLATCNDIGKLPVELLRRGRFDEVFFFDLPTEGEREAIFALHLAQRGRQPGEFALARLAAATPGFSGAEIEGVVVSALYHAFAERGQLSDAILIAEIEATRPLSRLRPVEVENLREWGAQHAVPA